MVWGALGRLVLRIVALTLALPPDTIPLMTLLNRCVPHQVPCNVHGSYPGLKAPPGHIKFHGGMAGRGRHTPSPGVRSSPIALDGGERHCRTPPGNHQLNELYFF